eukprot:CAMPEP_0174251410 /NCGR_PEP_ID=MMETSP0439-20130205/1241_1 /TAXON_ID=0 /ORGANISM="Stereomyxa ramosa, Strain Chinc5" /LENGTH=157 /DNA_ID=CAMNT_0015331713 /DNA_START=24 /DNA_END=497 /DNA_ORIENTATION=-
MPVYALQIKCELENLTNLRTDDEMRWYLNVKFASGETSDKPVYVNINEETQHHRAVVNLLVKDKFSGRDATISIVRGSVESYNAGDSGSWKTIIKFDCRGLEPIEFVAGMGFYADHHASGTTFELDLSDDFAEFDDQADEPVGVYNFESKIKAVKKK